MTTKTMLAAFPAVMDRVAELRAERAELVDTLAEVLRYDAPCDHAPDPESCTHCRGRALVARYEARV